MTEKRIGIVGSMKVEMDEIKAAINNPEVRTISGVDFISGTIEGTPVVVATGGVGKVFAGICTQTMILEYAPDLIINIGIAGSLTPELNIGDIAVADCVVQHDMDTTGVGDPLGLISGINVIEIYCCEDAVRILSESADKLGLHHAEGMIASGDEIIMDSGRKKTITDNFPAISCEMEGAAVGQVCYVNKTPFCVLRAISDNGDENAPYEYGMSREMAAQKATQVLLSCLGKLHEAM